MSDVLPVKMSFKQCVYALVRAIPRGKVLSYSRVAGLIDVPNGARAVGWVLRQLPDVSDVPWQRVINAKGYISIKGAVHDAADQRALLEAEGVVFDATDHVDMTRFLWKPSEWEARAILDDAALTLNERRD